MIRIDTKTVRYFVAYSILKEEEIYNKLVEEWKNKNNRGISVRLDGDYHLDKIVTINSDDIVQIVLR